MEVESKHMVLTVRPFINSQKKKERKKESTWLTVVLAELALPARPHVGHCPGGAADEGRQGEALLVLLLLAERRRLRGLLGRLLVDHHRAGAAAAALKMGQVFLRLN